MGHVHRRHHLLLEQRARVVVHAAAALFEDHLALGQNVLFVELEIGHAVGFHAHDVRKLTFLHALEIGCDVLRGEGIVLTA